MILCAFCRFPITDTPSVRRRMKQSKGGNLFCSHACYSLYREEQGIKKRQ